MNSIIVFAPSLIQSLVPEFYRSKSRLSSVSVSVAKSSGDFFFGLGLLPLALIIYGMVSWLAH